MRGTENKRLDIAFLLGKYAGMRNHLRTWRTDCGLTLLQAAERFGVTEAMLSRWETGYRRIPAERVRDIARITGISRHHLRPDIFEADNESIHSNVAI